MNKYFRKHYHIDTPAAICYSDIAPVAQWLEYGSYKPGVAGSIPVWRTIKTYRNSQAIYLLPIHRVRLQ